VIVGNKARNANNKYRSLGGKEAQQKVLGELLAD
jgi:hypothetical protein